MKYLLNKNVRMKHEINGIPIYFVWSVSKGRDTYGYNICTLREGFNRNKIASTCGGGYDMKGTVLADFIKLHFENELKRLNSKEFYGLSFWNPESKKYHKRYQQGYKICLNGACGFECMQSILNKIGFKLKLISECANEIVYVIEAN